MDRIKQDYLRLHPRISTFRLIVTFFVNHCFMAVGCYRMAHWCHSHRLPLASQIITRFARFVTSNDIAHQARIGPGLRLAHGFGTVVGAESRIGKHCTIGSCAVIGGNYHRYRIGESEERIESPVIGDYVHINAGAKVVGPVIVGDYVVIGANAVLTQDVKSYTLVFTGKSTFKSIEKDSEDFRRFFGNEGIFDKGL